MTEARWGSGASQRQVQRAVERYFQQHPPTGGTATDAQVAAAVASYLKTYPPAQGAPGDNATDAQVLDAVATYLSVNPPRDGQDATDQQVTSAVNNYLAAHPPRDGADATNAQVSTAVSAYLQANPPAPGQNATPTQILTAVTAYLAANPPAPAGVLLRQINVTDTAVIALTLGTVDKQYPCAGAVVGEKYDAYVRSFKLNNATTATPGRPDLYFIVSADCRVAGTINVVHSRPALALGAKYELFTDVVKVNAS